MACDSPVRLAFGSRARAIAPSGRPQSIGSTPISRLKPVFRESFQAELSETAFGHATMMEPLCDRPRRGCPGGGALAFSVSQSPRLSSADGRPFRFGPASTGGRPHELGVRGAAPVSVPLCRCRRRPGGQLDAERWSAAWWRGEDASRPPPGAAQLRRDGRRLPDRDGRQGQACAGAERAPPGGGRAA